MTAGAAVAQDARQYRGWDTNNDGVINRLEWRGTAQEFRNLDWNNDGVLSGNELRNVNSDQRDSQTFYALDRNGNGRLSRGEWNRDVVTFRQLDRNGDNQITRAEFVNANAGYRSDSIGNFNSLDLDRNGWVERDEWNGTRAAFNRHDANGDGVLTRRELANNDAAVASRIVEETVFVDARQPWTDTNLYVDAGDVISVRASGMIQMVTGGDDRATPAGSVTGRVANGSPRPDQKAGVLLGRIGNSPIMIVGSGGTITAPASGHIQFGVNDDHFNDNSGRYRVVVRINPR